MKLNDKVYEVLKWIYGSREYTVGRRCKEMKILKMLLCKHDYVFVRKLYGDEINAHNGKRNEYCCRKCGMLKWL